MSPSSKVLLLSVALLMGVPAMSSAPAKPCDTPAHHAFDFWLGEWQVHTPDGKLAGTNRVDRQYNGCVLHEHYATGHGYSGESLNVYDATRQVWHQTWVDSEGTLLLLEGGLRDGKMVLEGQTVKAQAPPTQHRITWTPNPDGSVRQLWESRPTMGEWAVVFDGLYTRK